MNAIKIQTMMMVRDRILEALECLEKHGHSGFDNDPFTTDSGEITKLLVDITKNVLNTTTEG